MSNIFMKKNDNSAKKKFKFWRYIIIWLIIIFALLLNKINVESPITVKKWDTYSDIWNSLSRLDGLYVKLYLKTHTVNLPQLNPGKFNFTGSFSSAEFLSLVTKWPQEENTSNMKLTILEWRNIYDIDKLLTNKWLIKAGEYIDYVSSSQNISNLKKTYSFISNDATTLEWYLYPDTYIINWNNPAIAQLIKLQLNNFQDRVWNNYQFLFNKLGDSLTADGFGFKLSSYSVLKLASIIENEEKNIDNKPVIAWIFLNRLRDGMRLEADYTICYGYKITYDLCTPSFIESHLYDTSNPYNTRKVTPWLPPTPINSPTVSSIAAVLKYNLNEYHYYLHGADGQIHYAKNLTEHTQNKNNYLK